MSNPLIFPANIISLVLLIATIVIVALNALILFLARKNKDKWTFRWGILTLVLLAFPLIFMIVNLTSVSINPIFPVTFGIYCIISVLCLIGASVSTYYYYKYIFEELID
ncbi:MAG: hypothetical protein ACTSRW_13450 [Candidatus Helarchaeota archaeon]